MSRKSIIFMYIFTSFLFPELLVGKPACFPYLGCEIRKVNCPVGDPRTCGSSLVRGSRLALDKRKPRCPDRAAFGGYKLQRRLCRPLKRQPSMSGLATEGRQGRVKDRLEEKRKTPAERAPPQMRRVDTNSRGYAMMHLVIRLLSPASVRLARDW
jgi:hypothetical protein